MPLLRTQPYSLAPFPKNLKPGEELFVIPETKECFRSYNEYIDKVFLYSSQVWSCQYTGRKDLTYKDAVESEGSALKQLEGFPECFKKPLLNAIHQGEEPIKALVEKCSKLLRNGFFPDEEVYVIMNPKIKRGSPAVIAEAVTSFNELPDLVVIDKENKTVRTVKEAVTYKCNVQLSDSNIIQTNISPDKIRRTIRIPKQELIKYFIKASAERCHVNEKKMWLVKEELITKYKLLAVSKAISDTPQPKNHLRSPLQTICAANEAGSMQTNQVKSSLKKPLKHYDPAQRTLNCFVQGSKKNVNMSTPSKVWNDSVKESTSSPLEEKFVVHLTPNSKDEISTGSGKKCLSSDNSKGVPVEKSFGSLRKESDSGMQKEIHTTVKNLIFDNEPKAMVTIDNPVSHCVKIMGTGKDRSHEQCRDCDDISSDKLDKNCDIMVINDGNGNEKVVKDTKIEEKKQQKEDGVKQHANHLSQVKQVKNKLNGVIIMDSDFGEKEKRLVQKNAMMKQKTLSQMFKSGGSMKLNTQADHKRTTEVVSEVKSPLQPLHLARASPTAVYELKIINEDERKEGKKLTMSADKQPVVKHVQKTARCIEDVDLALTSLPLPKPVCLPEELGQSYGDILMVAEFMCSHGNVMNQDQGFTVTPDGLTAALTSGTKSSQDLFHNLLIAFMNILLKDLHYSETVNKLLELDVELFEIPLTKEIIGEVTRLYLLNDHEAMSGQNGKKTIVAKQHLSPEVLSCLKKSDIIEASPMQKLQVLVYLVDKVLASDIFYDHFDDIEEQKRQAWSQKRELEKQIKDLKQEQEKKEETKSLQKEIGSFLVKDQENAAPDETTRSCGSECSAGSAEKPHSVVDECVDANKEQQLVEENSKPNILTKRQELVAWNKIEKEKENEARRFNEQLYQTRQKIERSEKIIQRAREGCRIQSLGSDRNYSRYWICPSHSVALLVEKINSSEVLHAMDCEAEDKEDKDKQREEKVSWYYYDNEEDFTQLVASLNTRCSRELLLRMKLKTAWRENKLKFSKRLSVKGSREDEEHEVPLFRLKEELADLGTRAVNGFVGDIDLENWLKNIHDCSSANDLVPYAVQLGLSIKMNYITTRLKKPEQWLKEKWIPSLQQARTLSRLHFCVILLDCCISWEKCSLYLKCKVCRKSGGGMALCEECRKAYHIQCLRPALDEVPKERWVCSACEPPVMKRRPVMAEAKEDSETWDAGEGGTAVQHENEDFCDVCGLEGDLVCCDYCPKSYHKQCHDPPMRNVPRGVWKCCTCQGRRPRARTKRVYREGELDDPSYFPEGVASKRSKLDENFDSCSSSNETVDSASSDDDDDDDALPARRTRNIVSKPTRASAVESAPPRQTKYANKERNADSRTRRDNKAVCLSKNEIPEARSRRNTSVVDKSRTGSPDEKENALDVRPARNPRQSDKKGTRKRRHSPEKENGGVNEGRRKSRQDSELKNCELLLKDLIKHEDSWPFLKPVDLSEVPDYLEVVSSPMDFETIRGRLDGLEYGCYQDFINDVRLVFSNSDKYNLETSEHGLAGISLEAYFKEILPSYFPKYENKILRSRNCSKRNTKRRL